MTRLRSFVKGDLDQLHELDRMCFPPGISYSIAELRYFLVSPRCLCWIAEGDAEQGGVELGGAGSAGLPVFLGFLIVERQRRAGGMSGHIITIDVRPEARRHGVGKLLMQSAEAQMKREGANRLVLEVAVDNNAAMAFYGRMGFFRTARIPEYYPGRLDAEVMEKAI